MIRRLLCVCSLLVLPFASVALGQGTYQRTKDGKTIVWNDSPKPGDTATWAGDRDADGYAAKIGTLTWYTARGTVYARFRGNMVRGKFHGTVNGYSKGKTAHAVFVDGQKTTRWAAGIAQTFEPAPTPQPNERIAKTDTAKLRNVSPATERAVSSPNRRERDAAPDKVTKQASSEGAPGNNAVSAVQPVPLRASPTPNIRTVPEPTASASPPNVATNDVWSEPTLPTPPEPVPDKAREKASQSISAPGSSTNESSNSTKSLSAAQPVPLRKPSAPNVSTIPEPVTPEPGSNVTINDLSSQQSGVGKPPTPAESPPTGDDYRRPEPEAPAAGPQVITSTDSSSPPTAPATSSPEEEKVPAGNDFRHDEPEAPAEGPHVVATDNAPAAASPNSAEQQPTEGQPSVVIDAPEQSVANGSLTGDATAETGHSNQSAATPQPVLKKADSPPAPAHLTTNEVIRIANAEVRKRGFNRADYRREEPEFQANTWSVAYDPMTVDGTETAAQRFSVVIDDRTRGAVFVPRK